MVTCEKVQKYPVGFTTESLPLDMMVICKNSATVGIMAIGKSLGDCIQHGRCYDVEYQKHQNQ